MMTKDAYIVHRRAMLRGVDTEIARLTDFAEEATLDVAVDYHEAIRGLQNKNDKAAISLREVGSMSDEEWERKDTAIEAEAVWKEMRSAVLFALSATYHERFES